MTIVFINLNYHRLRSIAALSVLSFDGVLL
jgi:hypothetical protein